MTKKKSPLDKFFPKQIKSVKPALEEIRPSAEALLEDLVLAGPSQAVPVQPFPVRPFKCGRCGGDLIPSSCGCLTEGCVNHVSKWPKHGTMYEPPKT